MPTSPTAYQKMTPAKRKRLRELMTKQLTYELVEDLIDAATDLGVGQANPMVDTRCLELNLNQAVEKLYNALDTLAEEDS